MNPLRHYLRISILGSAITCLLSAARHAPVEPAPSPASYDLLIRRDTFGVPHIKASSIEAAAYGLGYAQAEDHAMVLVREYMAARGESARYFGGGAENDLLMAFFRNMAESQRDLVRVTPDFRRYLEGFARGVNRYVQTHRSELPAWVPQFTAVDLMAHRRAAAIRQVYSAEAIRALERKEGKERPVPNPPGDTVLPSLQELGEEDPGSNGFALSGSRTTSGHPILLGNPHLNWSSLYWEAQITVKGKFSFFGSTLAGIPVLRAGFNEHLGWVTTNNYPDHTDIYSLRLDPAHPDTYLFEGKKRPLRKREVRVTVLQQSGILGEISKTYWESHLGRIILRTPTSAYAVRSAFLDAFQYYEGFYQLAQTRNLEEFVAVLDKGMMPMSNYTYADARGNILYAYCGRVPVRPRDGTDFQLDVPGDAKKYVWTRLHRARDLPRLLNPRGGYIQNCNNPPLYTSLIAKPDLSKIPDYLEREKQLQLRPQMALEMLASQEKFSLEEVKRLKYNDRMLLADRVKPDLLAALRTAAGTGTDLEQGLKVLESWDNKVEAHSRGAVLFTRFWDTYSSGLENPFAKKWSDSEPIATPAGLGDPQRAVRAFGEAVRWTREKFGSPDVAWGDVHRFRQGDMDLPGDGASGSYGMFRVVRFTPQDDGKSVAGQVKPDDPPLGFGDAWVLIVHFSQPIEAHSVLAYGQTTRTASVHSRDQMRLFAGHSYKKVWFREEEILVNLEREYTP